MINPDLLAGYQDGSITGAIVDSLALPAETRRQARYARDAFLASCDKSPYFSERAAVLSNLDTKKGLALPFVPYLKKDSDALKGTQQTGDCFSWATRGIIDITRVNEAIHNGDSVAYVESSATCLIYGLRGHSGQGMTLYSVINACKKGGLLLEIPYNYNSKRVDFSNYMEYWPIGANAWPRTNVPQELLEQTREYSIKDYAIPESMEEVDAALFSGRAISCGSAINPATVANQGLVSLQRSPIAHAMIICGVDKTREFFTNDDVYVWDNSWGEFIRYQSHFPWAAKLDIPMPEGYFCLTRDDTWRAIREKGSVVVSGIEGFQKLNLPDLGTIGRLF